MNGEQFRYVGTYIQSVLPASVCVRVVFCNDGNTLCTVVRQRVKYAQSGIHTGTLTWARIMGKLRSGITELSCYVDKPSTAVSLPLISALRRNISRFSIPRASSEDLFSLRLSATSRTSRYETLNFAKLTSSHVIVKNSG